VVQPASGSRAWVPAAAEQRPGGLDGRFPGTKFVVPRVPAGVVPRELPVAGLAREVLAVPLTLLSAPAGYGKTVMGALLVGGFSAARVCWVSIDSDDNDPRRFVAAMTVALRGAAAPTTPASMLHDPPTGDSGLAGARRMVIGLVNAISAVPEPVVFVLDELEAVTEATVYDEIGVLVERAPSNLHLVVTTRYDPPLALARLRARGLLAERGVPELRFTEAEVADLVNGRLGLNLSADAVKWIYERTEGWPVGVRLLASSLASSASSRALGRLPTGNRQIFEFLAEEVFDRQPSDVRRFLVQTSVLSRVTGPASAAVSGDANAAELLHGLDRRGLFVVEHATEDAERIYQYHDLFARFLRSRLERWPADERVQLYRRAAAVEQDPAVVAAHLLRAADTSAAAEVLAAEGDRMLRMGRAASLRDLLDRLPAEEIAARPPLLAIRGELAFVGGDVAAARQAFERAERALTAPEEAAERAAIRARLSECLYLQADVDGSDRLLNAALDGPLDIPLRVRLLLVRAQLSTNWAGREAESERALRAALELAADGDRHTVEVAAANLLPGVAIVRGAIDQMERFYDVARRVLPPQAAAARLQLRAVAAVTGALRGAIREAAVVIDDVLREFDAFGGTPPFLAFQLAIARVMCAGALVAPPALDPVLTELERRVAPLADDNVRTPNVWYVIGRARWLQGRSDAVREARARLVAADPGPAYGADISRLALDGLVAIIDGDRRGAERILLQAVEMESASRLVNVLGSARISLACLYVQLRRPEQALRVAEPALAACARQRLSGPVLFEGRRITPLLRLAIDHGVQAQVARDLTEHLRLPATAVLVVPETGAQLTARETQVLGLLGAGLTNPKIAERLTIGEETVKTHVARVLHKLGVRSRAAAAVRAHELGVVGSDP
jgi:LuxR family maltose regulon positive regulatory protein